MDTYLNRMCGFADEGSNSIERQLFLTKFLGWSSIELRNVENENICSMSDKKFNKVYNLLKENNIFVSCFGSALCNWSRPITTPFEVDIRELRTAIPRMRKLDTKLIRIMSYPNDGLSKADWKIETFKRIGELLKIASGEGVVLAIENCDGWAVQSPYHFQELVEHFASDSFKVIFDPGNPISHGENADAVWMYYLACVKHIVHYHIKDCSIINNIPVHQYVTEGQCDNHLIIKDLLSRGYKGMFSIEPHLDRKCSEGMFIKYGSMANKMMADLLS